MIAVKNPISAVQACVLCRCWARRGWGWIRRRVYPWLCPSRSREVKAHLIPLNASRSLLPSPSFRCSTNPLLYTTQDPDEVARDENDIDFVVLSHVAMLSFCDAICFYSTA